MNARKIALESLINVIIHHASLSRTEMKDERDTAFVQSLCFGVCRHYDRLEAIANQLVQKPLKAKDKDILIIMLMGLYQLLEMRLPEYAAVSETVALCDAIKKSWAKALVNGVLRQFQRKKDAILNTIEKNPVAHFSHPAWLIEKIQQDWPDELQTILTNNNQHPPFSLRVNTKKISRENYLQKLSDAFLIPETTSGVILSKPCSAEALPGFFSGEVSVQDGAAQLAAELLHPTGRVLDACAAPGGKASHLLELGDVELVAVDHDPDRLESVRDNFKRLQLQGQCIAADAGKPETWWDGRLFDRILLDAPCSASGVIRRHPDIKLLRNAQDIPALAQEQKRLIEALWPLLKIGGRLLYVTCSIFEEENSAVIHHFLTTHRDAHEEKIEASWGHEMEIGRQLLPGEHTMDGFYFACLKKTN